jgi:hypothetical protein
MAQRRSFAPDDPFADLEKKVQILEREMAQQRAAMERLKSIGQPIRRSDEFVVHTTTRKSA